MSTQIGELLACPACKSPLDDSLACACGVRYVRVDGVPVLRRDDVLPDASGAYVGSGGRSRSRSGRSQPESGPVLRPRIVRRFGEPLGDPFAQSFPEGSVILNVGSGERNYGRAVVNMDIELGPSVDVVGVAEELPFRDDTIDGVILQAVLEHVADSERTLSEIARVLRPGAGSSSNCRSSRVTTRAPLTTDALPSSGCATNSLGTASR